jgi:hypothetical protein
MVRQAGTESRNRQRSKPGGQEKGECKKQKNGKNTGWKLGNIQDELAQRDRKRRDKYTGRNKRHLEGMETITRTGETDQGMTETLGGSVHVNIHLQN